MRKLGEVGRSLVLTGAGIASLVVARPAAAQPAPPPDGIAVGEFWFRPRVEVRARGEYNHHPVTTSGEVPILGTDLGLPAEVTHQWVVHERARFGLSVERGPLAAGIVVQDARVAGVPTPATAIGGAGVSTLSLHAAYLEAHTPESHPSFVRVGRQELAWGEGRLLGTSDWFLVPRSFDAVRLRWSLRPVDLEAFAALLAPPGTVPPEESAQTSPAANFDEGTGTQLYGLSATLHVDPLLHGQLMGLGRVVRSPYPPALTPSDTIVVDARVFGDRAGLAYSAEFAYELGHFSVIGSTRDIRAWAATAHLDWQTAWVFRPKFSIGGSYATGEDNNPSGTSRRFDPILPDARAGLGQMGLYAWSNVVDGSLNATLAPIDDVTLALGYRYVRLADEHGAWFAASLLPVGQNTRNDDPFLGHEIDAAITYSPLEALLVTAGYGAFITGDGARAILAGRADQGPRVLSAAFLQVGVVAP
jgi:alginate export protein